MKATGIVRRIDDLGRVVIPKEIRRTLRIREGDPLEIYTDSNGEVIFKKYSPMGELSEFAGQYAEVLSKASKQTVMICDTDRVLAASGAMRKEVLEKRISAGLEEYMTARRSFFASSGSTARLFPVEGLERSASVMYPIISSGDVTGSVIMLFDESGRLPTEVDNKLIATAAAFLGRQMED